MSLSLPVSNSPLRQMFEVNDLVHWHNLPTFREALFAARNFLAVDSAARSVNSLAVMADGTIRLLQVGKRGGVRRLWNFGSPI